jgi:patatin-like phospholipase/acyl hydrolase
LQVFGLTIESQKIRRILTLDGGGVRGLSSLLILREIMSDIGQETGGINVRPAEYFDLIGGTGTGGLIAIMLGILGMVPLRVIFVNGRP